MNLDAKSENLMASYKILCTSSGPRVCEALLLIECLCPFKGSLIQGQSIGSLRSGMLNGNSLKHFLLFQVLAECKLWYQRSWECAYGFRTKYFLQLWPLYMDMNRNCCLVTTSGLCDSCTCNTIINPGASSSLQSDQANICIIFCLFANPTL